MVTMRTRRFSSGTTASEEPGRVAYVLHGLRAHAEGSCDSRHCGPGGPACGPRPRPQTCEDPSKDTGNQQGCRRGGMPYVISKQLREQPGPRRRSRTSAVGLAAPGHGDARHAFLRQGPLVFSVAFHSLIGHLLKAPQDLWLAVHIRRAAPGLVQDDSAEAAAPRPPSEQRRKAAAEGCDGLLSSSARFCMLAHQASSGCQGLVLQDNNVEGLLASGAPSVLEAIGKPHQSCTALHHLYMLCSLLTTGPVEQREHPRNSSVCLRHVCVRIANP
mmetsp:Transcript_48224/g.137752  ORF Transcript_48224/g.137752 Transcript_48224/m.137752 type:complete len:273 (-) Transcript_48224:71-889(-)